VHPFRSARCPLTRDSTGRNGSALRKSARCRGSVARSPCDGERSPALAKTAVRRIATGGKMIGIVEVRISAIKDCYISAMITGSTYGGGAHPYEDYGTLNWNRRAKRPIAFSSLFQANPASQNGALNLYKKRLGESATGVSDESLQRTMQSGFLLMDSGLRIIEQEGRSRIERFRKLTFHGANFLRGCCRVCRATGDLRRHCRSETGFPQFDEQFSALS